MSAIMEALLKLVEARNDGSPEMRRRIDVIRYLKEVDGPTPLRTMAKDLEMEQGEVREVLDLLVDIGAIGYGAVTTR